ncbi:MAG: TonB-dependent receptor domain-containing protein [Candidatus Acidiferrales bacterium]
MPAQRVSQVGRLLLILFCFELAHALFLWDVSHAQGADATLTGRVLDPTGALVVGARVNVVSGATNIKYSTQTNEDGIYTLPNLPPGPYQIEVSKPGFKTLIKPDVVLHVQDVIAINFRLPLGAVSESVTVTAGVPMVNTTDGSIGTVIDRRFVENLPLNGRTFQTLLALTPGVILSPANANDLGQFNINGQRADANYFTVDGVSANISMVGTSGLASTGAGALPSFSSDGVTSSLVSVDAMQEFKIQTSTYAPEFGRQPGGQVQIVTRSGTSQYHGTAFEYLRNDVLDASNWFNGYNQHPPLPKSKERLNDFGGVLGGPIVKDKTFFFVSYEGFRLREPNTMVTLVPTVAARMAPTPADIIPFLNGFPLPSPNTSPLPGDLQTYNASYSNPSTLNAGSIRIDHYFNHKLRLFGRYNIAPSDRSTRSNPASVLQHISLRTQTLTTGLTWEIEPTISNEFRFNWSRTRASMFSTLDSIGGAIPPPTSVLFPNVSSQNSSVGFSIQSAGAQLAVGPFGNNLQRQLNFVDTMSVTKGSHLIKFGIDYRYLYPQLGPVTNSQIAIFFGVPTMSDIAAEVLVGTTDGVSVGFKNFSVFAQDTWKIWPRLTFTYGLRWDVNPAPNGRNGKQFLTARGINDPATLSLAPPGTPLYNTSYRAFAPRLGIAYELSERQGWSTTIRGGYGLFYDLGSGEAATASGSFPFSRFNQLFGVPFPLSAANAMPPPFNPNPASVSFIEAFDPDLELPLTYQWNLSVQQGLGLKQSFTASYVGSAGRRLLQQQLLIAPDPKFQTISITKNTGTSDYDALQLQFLRNLSRGLQALASYTWSHSLDTQSHNSFDAGGGERGASDFDVRQSFNTALTYDFPKPSLGTIGNAILGNWSTDAIFFARTATPVDLIGGFTLVGPINELQRPDVKPGVPLYVRDSTKPGGRVFNVNAFAAPPPGAQGNFGRNVLRGFGAWQLDFAVHRQFNLTERTNLQFRAEFFNILNHPNFANPQEFTGTFIFSPLFGQSTTTLNQALGLGGQGLNPTFQIGGPRSIQVALKFNF